MALCHLLRAKRLLAISSLMIFSFATACNSSLFGAGTSRDSRRTSAKDSINKLPLGVSYDSLKTLPFEKQIKVSTKDFVEIAKNYATNELIEIKGYDFLNIKDRLLDSATEIDALTLKYPSLEDFLATVNIHTAADIVDEQVEAGLAALAESIQNMNDVSIAPPSDEAMFDKNISERLFDGLNLTGRDRFLMGLLSLPYMTGDMPKLNLLANDNGAYSGAIQANSTKDKSRANPQDGEDPIRPMCVTVIFVGDLDNPECLDAVDRMTPCPCI